MQIARTGPGQRKDSFDCLSYIRGSQHAWPRLTQNHENQNHKNSDAELTLVYYLKYKIEWQRHKISVSTKISHLEKLFKTLMPKFGVRETD